MTAIAQARPGGVALHCGGGRDRAGQISALALAAVGVSASTIAEDYSLSAERLRARYAHRGEPDQGPQLEAYLAAMHTSASEAIERFVSADLETPLARGGFTADDHAALRARLTGSPFR